MRTVLNDLRHALRRMGRSPLTSCAMVAALAIGIGLNAGVFSIIDGFWFQAPVEKDSSSFVQVIPRYSGWFATENQVRSFTTPDYDAIRGRSRSLAQVAAWAGAGGAGPILLDDDPKETAVVLATCNFFQVYGLAPRMGRLFLPQESPDGSF